MLSTEMAERQEAGPSERMSKSDRSGPYSRRNATLGMQSVTYAYAERQRDTKRSRCRWKRELSGRKEIVAPAGLIM